MCIPLLAYVEHRTYLMPSSNVAVESASIKPIETGPYSLVDLHDFAPSNPKRKYHFIKEIKNVPVIFLVSGNNFGKFHFI